MRCGRVTDMQPSAGDLGVRPSDPAYKELKSVIVHATGHCRLAQTDSLLLKKVSGRLRETGLSSLGDYLSLLRNDAQGNSELDSLIGELTVGETFFFRHPAQFDALRNHVLPACLKRNERSRRLRIWSAGCANGAEPYSVAIVVHALLGRRLADWSVSIIATDLNRALLAKAKRGLYSAWSLRGVPRPRISAHFSKRGGEWAIKDDYKKNVTFMHRNLVHDDGALIGRQPRRVRHHSVQERADLLRPGDLPAGCAAPERRAGRGRVAVRRAG